MVEEFQRKRPKELDYGEYARGMKYTKNKGHESVPPVRPEKVSQEE
jgi:hypothetical protein